MKEDIIGGLAAGPRRPGPRIHNDSCGVVRMLCDVDASKRRLGTGASMNEIHGCPELG